MNQQGPIVWLARDGGDAATDELRAMLEARGCQVVLTGAAGPATPASEKSTSATVDAWQAILDTIHDPVAVFDGGGILIHCNRAFETRFAAGGPVAGRGEGDLLWASGSAAGRVGFVTFETDRLSVAGTFLISQSPIERPEGSWTVYHLVDVGARKRAERAAREGEARLRQSQRLETIGRLSTGVVHDFNNLLTTVLCNADLLLESRESGRLTQVASELRDAAERGAALTRRLLRIGSSAPAQLERIDLNAMLTEMGRLLRRLVGDRIEIVVDTDQDLAQVQMDRAQLEQVVLNLVVNARDAMPGGGRLTIETRPLRRPATDAESRAVGRYARMSFRDDGEGMDDETLARCWEPFFTTKEAGRGTGLGLSVVHTIVTQHGGSLEVRSAPGKGTTIDVDLPAISADSDPPRTARPEVPPDLRGTETILLVEDEDGVRRIIQSVLEVYGYRVIGAENAEQALLRLESGDGRIDLVCSDIVMPGMSGVDLVNRLRSTRPGLKVLLMTGYAAPGLAIPEGVPIIDKPFRAAELAGKLRELLASPASPDATTSPDSEAGSDR